MDSRAQFPYVEHRPPTKVAACIPGGPVEPTVNAETFAAELPAKMLACRELGHRWAPRTVQVVWATKKRVGGYERVMRCTSCHTERVQTLDTRGGVVTNAYRYSDGYLANHVERGFTRDTFRLESVNRWLTAHQDAEAV